LVRDLALGRLCEDGAVPAFVLILTGTFALAWGLVRGYVCARAALQPLVSDGEPTRRLIESTKPVYERTKVRTSVRSAVSAVVWLVVAMYGLFLMTVGVEVYR
jgi:hypothetical protein